MASPDEYGHRVSPLTRHATLHDRHITRKVRRPHAYGRPNAYAQAELDAFEQSLWGLQFPTVAAAWRRVWDKVIPFFAFPPEVRRVIYTTNEIESVNVRVRKISKTRGHFPSAESATKLRFSFTEYS